jgi:hypothetical protein
MEWEIAMLTEETTERSEVHPGAPMGIGDRHEELLRWYGGRTACRAHPEA